MANWVVVLAYDDQAANWLVEQGYARPPVRAGNVMPTTDEMKWALEAEEGLVFDYPSGEGDLRADVEGGEGWEGLVLRGFDWDAGAWTPGDHFFARGSAVLLSVLVRLCQRCGQLVYAPDDGAPWIILDAEMDYHEVADLYAELAEAPDGWEAFLEAMYGPGGLAAGQE